MCVHVCLHLKLPSPCNLWTLAAPWQTAALENLAPLLSPGKVIDYRVGQWVAFKERKGSYDVLLLKVAPFSSHEMENSCNNQVCLKFNKGQSSSNTWKERRKIKYLKSSQDIKLELFPGICVCVCVAVYSIPSDNFPGCCSEQKNK